MYIVSENSARREKFRAENLTNNLAFCEYQHKHEASNGVVEGTSHMGMKGGGVELGHQTKGNEAGEVERMLCAQRYGASSRHNREGGDRNIGLGICR